MKFSFWKKRPEAGLFLRVLELEYSYSWTDDSHQPFFCKPRGRPAATLTAIVRDPILVSQGHRVTVLLGKMALVMLWKSKLPEIVREGLMSRPSVFLCELLVRR